MNLHDIMADIHALELELLNFERKYGIRSETLYAAYIEGDEPEDDSWVLDFGEWASIYLGHGFPGRQNTVMKFSVSENLHPA